MDLIKFLIYVLLFLEIYGFGFFTQNKDELNIECMDDLPLKPLFVDGFMNPFRNVYSLLTFNFSNYKKTKSIGSPYFVINLIFQFHKFFENYNSVLFL